MKGNFLDTYNILKGLDGQDVGKMFLLAGEIGDCPTIRGYGV